jgi:hypothetical protein
MFSTNKHCEMHTGSQSIYNLLEGIWSIELEKTPAILVDNEELRSAPITGANCSNRGCDLKLWTKKPFGDWSIIFDQHAFKKFVSIEKKGAC